MATESKQIDGVVDDPENGGLKSGPCLIAGFHALSCTSPSYYNPYRGVNKNTLSVDMVRLSLTFKGDRGEWLSRKGAQLTDCDEMSAWTSKIRPGGWYELWSFALGGSSVALGIGFMEPSCKVNMHKGFIEFNPNKVAGDKRFHGLLKTLGTCVSKARLKRFDLAYDIPVSRYDCRLSKDRRMYKSVISNGITEYLGVKNTPAYVKVYDKHANMKYKFGNRKFWAEGYYVSTVGLNEATIAKYIREQEKADIAIDRLSVKEYEDPFDRGPGRK